MASGREGRGSSWPSIQRSRAASWSGWRRTLIDVPSTVAGRPRLFAVPLIDMVNKRCHEKQAEARLHPRPGSNRQPIIWRSTVAQIPLRAESACANPIGRREALAALALFQIATVPAVQAQAFSSTSEGWKPLSADAAAGDVDFWRLHARRSQIDADWKAAFANYPDRMMPDDAAYYWGGLHHEAERAMMIAPISTLAALRAKVVEIKAGEMDALDGDDEYPAPIDLVLRDIEYMIVREHTA